MQKINSEDKLKALRRPKKLKEISAPAPDILEQVETETLEPGAVPVPRAAAVPARKMREVSEFIEKVVAINRITKVNKGGKKLSFSALVVVGDSKGNVGYNLAKASEVSIAIRKAIIGAKRNMVRISLKGTTIPHEIIGECGASRVLLKPAGDGTGVIAAGPVRAVCDGAGIRNILTKCHRSNNPINVIKATFDGLRRLKSEETALPEVLPEASPEALPEALPQG